MSTHDNMSSSVANDAEMRCILTKLSTILSQSTSLMVDNSAIAAASPSSQSMEEKYRQLSHELKLEISRSSEAHSRARYREQVILNLQNENELLRLRLSQEVSGQLDSHHWEERYTALRAKLSVAEQTICGYQEKVDRMDEYLRSSQAELRDALRVSSALNNKALTSEDRANRALAESRSLTERLKKLREETDMSSGKVISLTRKLATLQKVEEMVAMLEEDNRAISNKLRDVSQEKLQAVESAARSQIALASLQSALKIAQDIPNERVVERMVYMEPSEDTQSIINELRRKNSELSSEICHLTSEMDKLRFEREALRKRLIFFQKKTQPLPPTEREVFLATQIDDLKKDIFDERKERERAQKEVFILKERSRKTERQLRSAEDMRLKLQYADMRAKAREIPNTPPRPQRQYVDEDSDDIDLEELLEATPAVLLLPNKN